MPRLFAKFLSSDAGKPDKFQSRFRKFSSGESGKPGNFFVKPKKFPSESEVDYLLKSAKSYAKFMNDKDSMFNVSDIEYDKWRATFRTKPVTIFDYDPELRYMSLSDEQLESIYRRSLVKFTPSGKPKNRVKPVLPEPAGYAEFRLRQFAVIIVKKYAHELFGLSKAEFRKICREYQSYKPKQKSNRAVIVMDLFWALKMIPNNTDPNLGVLGFKIKDRIDFCLAFIWSEHLRLSRDNRRYVPHRRFKREADELKKKLDDKIRESEEYRIKRANRKIIVRVPENAHNEIERKRTEFESRSLLPVGEEMPQWQKYLLEKCEYDVKLFKDRIRDVIGDKKNFKKKIILLEREAKEYFASGQDIRRRTRKLSRCRIKYPDFLERVDPSSALRR